MRVKALSLRNFRNISSLNLTVDPKLNRVVGKNAQGKTNLLEAIYYLAYLTSFRTSARTELINLASQDASLGAVISRGETDHTVSISLSQNGRRVRLDDKVPETLREYGEEIKIVLFSPDDVSLFKETPSIRRKAIRLALFLNETATWEEEARYRDVVDQKNRLLKEGSQGPNRGAELAVWNEQLVHFGARVTRNRLGWVAVINRWLSEAYRRLTGTGGELRIRYEADYLMGSPEGDFPDVTTIEKKIQGELEKRGADETRRREAVVGPHRDDWTALLDGRAVGPFGSQGESRSAALALRLAQVWSFEEEKGYCPILLLDDLASELDDSRVKACFACLKNLSGQVFVTSASVEAVLAASGGSGASFMVEEGKVRVLTS